MRRSEVLASQSRDCISDNDVVVISAKRTPIGKARRGFFKDTYPDDLLAVVFTALLKDANVQPDLVGDICIGNVMNSNITFIGRIAQFKSGIPDSVPISSCNRFCSSGLQSVMNIASSISNGICDIGIAVGIEMMTHDVMNEKDKSIGINPQTWNDISKARDCLIPMGITSEIVAERFGISREKQDRFALISHQKAAKAHHLGLMKDEIIPVTVTINDKNGASRTLTVDKDDGFRPETNMNILAKQRAVFKEGGSTTAANSSQICDGAAGVLLARRSAAIKLDLPIIGVIKAYVVIGLPPDIMGIGPALAIPEALRKTGTKIQ